MKPFLKFLSEMPEEQRFGVLVSIVGLYILI